MEAREGIIADLCTGANLLMATRVDHIAPHPMGWLLRAESLTGGLDLVCKNLVIAAGRDGPLLAQDCLPGRVQVPLRIEVGIRIEQRSQEFFLREHPRLDPKLIFRDRDAGVEWRTFCCCRDGSIVAGRSYGIESLSGHADCPSTGRSNIGFNVRILDSRVIELEWPPLPAASRPGAD